MIRINGKNSKQDSSNKKKVRTTKNLNTLTSDISNLNINSTNRNLQEPASYPYLTEILTVPDYLKPAQNRILKRADVLFNQKNYPYNSDEFLEKYVPIRLTEIHHSCFLKGINWDDNSSLNARTILFQELTIKGGQTLSEKSLQKLDAILETIKNPYTYNEYGGHFKSEVKTTTEKTIQRLPATQISCTKGRVFDLIKDVDRDQAKTLSHIMSTKIIKGPCKVGKGGLSTIRYAYEPASRSYFAAKQVDDLVLANAEISIQKELPDNILFVKMIDFAHIYREGKYVKTEIIYPLVTHGDAFDFIIQNCQSLNFKSKQDRLFIKKLAFGLINPVAYLHSSQFCHRDIKPENYLVGDNNLMHLSDFSFAAKTTLKRNELKYEFVGTPGYLPWNFYSDSYTGIYHDNVSLGLTLLQAVHGTAIMDIKNYAIPLNGMKIPLQFGISETNPRYILCLGINRKHYSIPLNKYDNLYEIAAGLLDTDPETQLQTYTAVRLPYFNET